MIPWGRFTEISKNRTVSQAPSFHIDKIVVGKLRPPFCIKYIVGLLEHKLSLTKR